jgi:hypothetical protein
LCSGNNPRTYKRLRLLISAFTVKRCLKTLFVASPSSTQQSSATRQHQRPCCPRPDGIKPRRRYVIFFSRSMPSSPSTPPPSLNPLIRGETTTTVGDSFAAARRGTGLPAVRRAAALLYLGELLRMEYGSATFYRAYSPLAATEDKACKTASVYSMIRWERYLP